MKTVGASWIALMVFNSLAWAQNQAQHMTDPQIAQMLKEINQADIDGAQLAQKKTKSNSIQSFAQQIEKDHKGLDLAGSNLLKRQKMNPEESEGSKALKENMTADLDKLKKMEGVEFDKSYLNHEVTFHQRAKDLVDRSLLPNVKDAAWKELLSKEDSVLSSHLQHAQTIQKSTHK